MEKRVIMAIALSILILLAYQTIIAKLYPNLQQEVTKNKTKELETRALETKLATERQPLPAAPEIPEELFTKETEKFVLTFSNIGGRIKEVFLKDYNKKLLEMDFVVIEGYEQRPFVLSQERSLIVYTYQDQDMQIQKEFNIYDNSYTIDIETAFRNLGSSIKERTYRIYNCSLDLKEYSQNELASRESYFLEFSVAATDKVLRHNFAHASKKQQIFSDRFTWVGVRDRYFCSILYPLSPVSRAFIQPFGKQRVTSGIETATLELIKGTKYNFNARLYIGPQDINLLSSAHEGFEQLVSFGTFDIISRFLLKIMRLLYSYIHSWGICIILISLLIFLVLYPLTAKSLISMKKMQALQPEIEKLRVAYKGQPQKLNKELMELYRENKVNPFGGCLPMFLQIPVFFGLYQALMRSVELKGAKFLWIQDLAEPDRIFTLKNSFPVIGDEINLLPLIMIVAMFLQQKLSMKSAGSSTMQDQQKMMLILFPLLFGFLFYHFPSGLTLYWVSYTILSVLSQRRINRAAA